MVSDQLTVSGVFCSPRIVKSWGEEHNFVISQVEEEPPALCLTGQACEGWHLTNLRLVQKSASRWKRNWEESYLVRKAWWAVASTRLTWVFSCRVLGRLLAVDGGRWAHQAPTGLAHTQCHRSPYSIALGGGLRSWDMEKCVCGRKWAWDLTSYSNVFAYSQI